MNSSDNIKQQYPCIDLLKFFFSFFVVALHVGPFESFDKTIFINSISYLFRLAVPFFFTASGFFLFKKFSTNSSNKEVSTTFIKRIFKLYVLWTIIYIPLIIYFKILKFEGGIVFGVLDTIRNFFFTGSYTHLWYLNAMIVAVIIISFLLHKKFKIHSILVIAFIIYLIGLLPQSYFGLLKPLQNIDFIWQILRMIKNIISTTRNGLFIGFIFMALGLLFAKNPPKIKFSYSLLGLFISLVLFITEVNLLNHFNWIREHDVYLFLVPTTFFLFNTVINIKLDNKKIFGTLRKISSLVFYCHLIVNFFVQQFLAIIGLDNINSLISYLFVILASVICSIIIIKLSQTKRFAFLKKLY